MALVWVTLSFTSLAQEATAPPSPAVQTPHLILDLTLSYAPEGSVMLEYRLTNVGTAPFVVDPSDLQVLYGAAQLPYKLVHTPAPGRANRLSPGEAESGTITVSDPPHDSDNLLLIWSVTEIGPNVEHILLKRFGDMILKSNGAAMQLPKQRALASGVRRRRVAPQLYSLGVTSGAAQASSLAIDLPKRFQAAPAPTAEGRIQRLVLGRKLA